MHKAGMVQRVTNEVEIQCRLKHPSILEVKLQYWTSLDIPQNCLLCIFEYGLCFNVAMVIQLGHVPLHCSVRSFFTSIGNVERIDVILTFPTNISMYFMCTSFSYITILRTAIMSTWCWRCAIMVK